MSVGPVALDARTASPHFPGIGRVVTGLTRALARRRDGPPLILLHGATPDARLADLGLPGLVCRSSPFDIRQHWELRAGLRRAGAGLYHGLYYLVPLAPGVRSVVNCHDLIPLTVPGLFGPLRRVAIRIAHALAFRSASVIVVPSAATRADLHRLFPAHAARVAVVPYGSDFSRPADQDRSARIRRQLGLPQSYVLVAGSNKPHKNLATMADAWARLVDRRRGDPTLPRLVLAGPRDRRFGEGGPHAERLRQTGLLVSIGSVPDQAMPDLYAGALLLVCPSRAEGFGLPVIEAMGCGTPVACSSIPALRELAGPAAALFDPEDADALSRLVERLIDSPDERLELQRAGLARAAAFTWDRAARAMCEIYGRIREGRT